MEDTKIVPLTFEYHENNYYHESSLKTTQKVSLVPVTIDTRTEISNEYYNLTHRALGAYYYRDEIRVIAMVKIAEDETYAVNEGSVDFTFVKDDDPTQYKYLLNPSPIKLDNSGYAAVRFIPRGSGKIFIQYYNDDSFFKSSEEEEFFTSIEIKPLPTEIQFTNDGSILMKPEETIDLNVKVTIADVDHTPVSYGVVTFLQYWTEEITNVLYDKERVIGNPVFLDEEGNGTIKYSPIQVYSRDEYLESFASDPEIIMDNISNVEIIRAYYNYGDNEYGEKWDYYDEVSTSGSVGVSKANSLNVHPPTDINDQPLSVGYDGLFSVKSGEHISFAFYITDESNNIINLNDIVTEDINTVFSNVFKVVLKNSNEESSYNFSYNTNNNNFIATINTPNNEGIFYLTVEVNQSELQRLINEGKISDNFYINQEYSDPIYFNISHEESSDVSLKLEQIGNMNTYYIINGTENIDFKLSIESLIEGIGQYFDGENCYFMLNNIKNRVINKVLEYKNGECFTTISTSELKEIGLTSEGNYNIQVYINETDKTINDVTKHFNTIYSNQITIYARQERKYSIQKITNTEIQYPGKIQYSISHENSGGKGTNIADSIDTTVTIIKNEDSSVIHTFDTLITNTATTFTYDDLDVGNYTIKAEVKGTNKKYKIQESNLVFSVVRKKLTLSFDNKETTLSEIPTAISQNLILYTNRINDNIDKIINKIENIDFNINGASYKPSVIKTDSRCVLNFNNITTLQQPGTYNITASSNNINFTNVPQIKAEDIFPTFYAKVNSNNTIEITMRDYSNNIVNQTYTINIYQLLGGIEGDYSFGVNGISKTSSKNGDYYSIILKESDTPNWNSDGALTSCDQIEVNYTKTSTNANKNVVGFKSLDSKVLISVTE